MILLKNLLFYLQISEFMNEKCYWIIFRSGFHSENAAVIYLHANVQHLLGQIQLIVSDNCVTTVLIIFRTQRFLRLKSIKGNPGSTNSYHDAVVKIWNFAKRKTENPTIIIFFQFIKIPLLVGNKQIKLTGYKFSIHNRHCIQVFFGRTFFQLTSANLKLVKSLSVRISLFEIFLRDFRWKICSGCLVRQYSEK